jgi:hypothetical protein
MSYCTGHEQCPQCAKLGKDRNGDNLAVYSDGGKHCFSCGYHVFGSSIARLKSRTTGGSSNIGTTRTTVTLPRDVDEVLPHQARNFLTKYELTELDAQVNHCLWSEKYERLIFPYFDEHGLYGWQGRYLGLDKEEKKWYGLGKIHEHIHVVGNTKLKTIVLTEDVLSAIKVAKTGVVCGSPLFGSHIPNIRFLQLAKFYDTIIVWLDKDKQKEAIKFAQQARNIAVNTTVIITNKDPKEYTLDEIKNYLNME